MTRQGRSLANELAADELRDLTAKCRTAAGRASDQAVSVELRQMASQFAAMAQRFTS
jgi:hypothetical protein